MYSMSETFRVTSVMSSVFAVAAIKESKTGLCRPLNSAFATDSPQVSATDVLYARILCEYCVSNASSKPDNSAARLVSPRSCKFFFFLAGSSFPDQGSNLPSLQWKGVLATGWPGKSL